MIRTILTAACFLLVSLSTKACDICGCGVGGYYIGILPDFNKTVFGIRYRHNHLRTHIGAGGESSYLTTDETYRTAELWGGWSLGKKFRMMGYLPVSFNEKHNQGETYHKTGMGDIGLQGYYNLLNRRKTYGEKLLVQTLWAGVGVKLPVGKYDNSKAVENSAGANLFQLGTGSVDFTLNAMYDIRLQDLGLSVVSSYKINTANRYDYQYGNKFSLATQLYHKWRVKNKYSIAPNAGLSYETAKRDLNHEVKTDVSGGHLVLAGGGCEISMGKWAVGANFQLPVQQNLANGFVKAGNRGMLHVSIVL